MLILNILLLDLIAPYLNTFTGTLYYLFVPVCLVAIIVFLVLSFKSKKESNILPVLALIITLITLAIIAFFMYLGANFA